MCDKFVHLSSGRELFSGSVYHLYGMGALAEPLAGTLLFELANWVGLSVRLDVLSSAARPVLRWKNLGPVLLAPSL